MNEVSKSKPLNICVFGNSHVSSLKVGWNLIEQDYPEIKITFFAARTGGLSGLKVENGLLVPNNNQLKTWLFQTSGGYEEIDLAQFDIGLLYGLRLAFPYKLEMGRIINFFSKAAYECAVQDGVDASLSVHTLKKIRQLSDMPMYLGHNPLNACLANTYLNEKFNYSDFIDVTNCHLANENAVLLAQPEETVTERIYTKPEYTSGALRLGVQDGAENQLYDEGDNVHMNGIFGRIYLEHLFAQIPGCQTRTT